MESQTTSSLEELFAHRVIESFIGHGLVSRADVCHAIAKAEQVMIVPESVKSRILN